MDKNEIVKSVCGLCTGSCGVLITMEDGKPVKIKGDPESPPSKGALCKKALTSLEYLDHPDRLKYPLRRAGERGQGKWEKISWDEAFGTAAAGLNKIKERFGAESVFMVHGSAKAFIDTDLVRLANAFGTPNVVTADHVCHVPRMLGCEFTFGYFPLPEIDHPPACIMAWGVNHSETRFYKYRGWLDAKKKGTRLIVIDPIRTRTAESADLWLQLKPGTDLALALGMIHVIINEGLYDRDFVDRWTVGFEQVKSLAKDYPPQKVSEITWIPADKIVEAARLYGRNRPGYVELGNAIDHTLNSFQASRALSILIALTGDLDVPGGEIELAGTGFRFGDTESSAVGILGRWSHELELRDKLTRAERQRKVDPDLLPDFRYVTPQSIVKAILEKDPYPPKGAFIQACNPLSSWCGASSVYDAFKELDFLAVSDLFMTPTAALADIVFPAASYLESDGIQMPPPPGSFMAQVQQKVAQVGDCRSDIEIVNGLAKHLGLGEYFWDSAEGFWDYVLSKTGLTFQEFKKKGRLMADKGALTYKKYEKRGFKTPSGKVELYSQQLKELGFAPLPEYHEIPEGMNNPAEFAEEYPLFCTSMKTAPYRHSTGKQISPLREGYPDPVVKIHPDTARRSGLKKDDWATIETIRGKIRQKVVLNEDLDPRVIVADYAWWFPEKGKENLYGWRESNYNVLTNADLPHSPEVGSNNIRGFACRIEKYESETSA